MKKEVRLTKSEEAILTLLAKGMLYKEIADVKGVSIDTVKKHCKNIYKKLEVRNRMEAVIKMECKNITELKY